MKPPDELSPPLFGGLFSSFPQTEFPMRTRITLPEPIGIIPYFDRIRFWSPNPLNPDALAELERACGPGNIHINNRPARFNNHHRQYRQRIDLSRPTRQALRWLARRKDALINRVEITLDLTFRYRPDAEEAWEFFHQHWVRRWHGRTQEISQCGDGNFGSHTRYDADRSAPNQHVLYTDAHTRITGELNCVHVECRLNRLKAVRAAGIKSGQDLLQFDHRAFWQERLLFYDVDRGRLGRLLRNYVTGRRRRTPEFVNRAATATMSKVGQEKPVRAHMRRFRN
jgi:hypothetical protein